MKYPIIISKDEDSDYCVSSPDIDLCLAVGKTKKEAVDLFRQAAEFHLKHLLEMGQQLPQPTALIEADTIEVPDIA